MGKPRLNRIKRRDFIKGALAAGAGLTLAGPGLRPLFAAQSPSAAEIRVAVVGCGSRGTGTLVPQAEGAADVRIVALCDPDQDRMDAVYNGLSDKTGVVRTRDVRDLVTNDNIDAFLIASPTHWHALMTTWACQAGKDVLCEKPVSHNILESRRMLDYANGYSRIVQVGTQRRAATGAGQARDYFAGGTLGAIQWIHCWWFSGRNPVGLQDPPWTPNFLTFDFDLYMGHAPLEPLPWGIAPLDVNDVHAGWHWNWQLGNGDMSNLGIHVFDQARFIAGIAGAPTRVRSLGNRYNFNDGGQTPNTQFTLMEYPDFPVVVENLGLKSPSPANPYDYAVRGVRIQCANGYIIGFEDATVYNNSGVPIASYPVGSPVSALFGNFFDAVRSRDKGSLIAPLEAVNPTNDACLIGNASYRMGTATDKNSIRAAIVGLGAAPDRFEDLLTHLAANGVNVDTNPLLMGPWLTFDESSGAITEVNGSTDPGPLATANGFITDTYRSSYPLPGPVPATRVRHGSWLLHS